MVRGIKRRVIFKGDKDGDDFIDRLASLLPETKITNALRITLRNLSRSVAERVVPAGLEMVANPMQK